MINKDIFVLTFYLISMMTLKGLSMPGSCHFKFPHVAVKKMFSTSAFTGLTKKFFLRRSDNESVQSVDIDDHTFEHCKH